MTTPGYKRMMAFERLVSGALETSSAADRSNGKIVQTGLTTDLALSGPGAFTVRGPEGVTYTRAGQFTRDADGRLVTPAGQALQTEDGRDLVVPDLMFEVLADGVVLHKGEPVAKLALTGADAAGAAEAATLVRQGGLEASNVSTADEMVAMMQALRHAETGQRLIAVYDELMGRVLTTVGQS